MSNKIYREIKKMKKYVIFRRFLLTFSMGIDIFMSREKEGII
jgi:hypothetical protein